jgi:hypothetical protein
VFFFFVGLTSVCRLPHQSYTAFCLNIQAPGPTHTAAHQSSSTYTGLSEASSLQLRASGLYPAHDLYPQYSPSVYLAPFILPDPAPDRVAFNEPLDGRFLCNVIGCPSTFTRKKDRDRHIDSVHDKITPHFCPFHGCRKSYGVGTPYTRRDRLLDHMQKKH